MRCAKCAFNVPESGKSLKSKTCMVSTNIRRIIMCSEYISRPREKPNRVVENAYLVLPAFDKMPGRCPQTIFFFFWKRLYRKRDSDCKQSLGLWTTTWGKWTELKSLKITAHIRYDTRRLLNHPPESAPLSLALHPLGAERSLVFQGVKKTDYF
jgi:hypothetical protein